MTASRLLSAIQHLTVHDHLCLIYKSRDEQLAAVNPFIRCGLERGEQCLYLVDDNAEEQICAAMRDAGIDVDGHRASGALTVAGTQETYCKQGCFDPGLMIEFLKRETEAAKRQGYTALRVTGETTWALGSSSLDRLIEYENRLNLFFPEHDCLALCQYNAKKFTPELIRDVIYTHPRVMYGGHVCDNCYFIPPDKFVPADSAQYHVECFLENIKERQNAVEQLRESEKKYKELVESANSIILRFTSDGTITFFNEFAQRFFGYTEEEIIGKKLVDTIVPPTETTGRNLKEMLEDIVRNPDTYINNENENLCRDGTRVWISWTNKAVTDTQGAVIEILSVGKDITAQKRADHERRFNESRLESLLQLNKIKDSDLNRLAAFALEESARLTRSEIGFINFLSEDEQLVTHAVYTKNTLSQCALPENMPAFRISECGLWSEAYRTKSPVIVNDYDSAHPSKKGLPDDHPGLKSFISIPVFQGDRVAAIAALGNKAAAYDQTDVRQFSLFMEGLWQIMLRRQAEEALQESEQKYHSLLEDVIGSSAVGVFILDAGLRVVWVNNALKRYFGLQHEDIIGSDKRKLIREKIAGIFEHPEEFSQKVLSAYKTNNCIETFECHVLPGPGREERWLFHWSQPITAGLYAGGRVEHYTDITHSKRTEAQLRQSEQNFRAITESTTDAIVLMDEAYTIIFWNRGAETILGYSAAEVIGKSALIIAPDRIKESLKQMLADIVQQNPDRYTGKTFETTALRKGGTEIPVEVSDSFWRLDGHIRFCSIFRDITDRKLYEETLKTSEREHRSILQTAMDGFLLMDMDGRLQEVNEAYCTMTGYSEQELLGMHISDLEAKETPADVTAHSLKVKEQGSDRFETKHRCKDGSIITVEISVQYKPEVKECFFAFLRDVTERKKAEEERVRLLSAIEQTDDTIIITDEKGIIQFANTVSERRSGFLNKTLIGMNLFFPQTSVYDDSFYREIWSRVSSGRIWKNYLKHRHHDGTLHDYATTITPIKNSDGAIINYVSVSRDVTRERQLEENLRQAQKMETVGTLAGGIAHEFNNIIGGMMGYAEVAKDIALEDSQVYTFLEDILTLGTRASNIVKQMLAFSRKDTATKTPLQAHAALKEQVKMLRNIIPSNIEMKTAIDERAGTIMVDATQMQQVGMNLCANAVHAMEDKGGVLEIGLCPTYIDEEAARSFHNIRPGRYVKLTISDTGPGIDPAIINRIFDPFFTTKEVNKGTGLGLSVVDGIVREHGGAISVASQPGAGTTFTIVLPAAGHEEEQEAGTDEKSIPRGTESVLVVDDEEAIVFTMEAMLERLGYSVTGLTGSLEALRLFRERPERFDLVITDLTMPGLTGDNLAAELHSIRADIPVILMTGYNDILDRDRITLNDIKSFISKPCKKAELAAAIRAALDGERPVPRDV